MSGWDEGGVYYSDQAQFPRGGGDQPETANSHKALQKFKEFIRNFQHKSQRNVFPYREALLSNPKYLLVDLADLISYDPDQTPPQFLRENPADYLPLLEAIVRLSEALARMTMSHVANDNHVLEAIRLFNNSTMDAARSGINQHINLTPEMANEIKQAETQIKRRMGIRSHISERRLIDELTRIGLNESIVRRALLIMNQREKWNTNERDELLSVKLEHGLVFSIIAACAGEKYMGECCLCCCCE